MNWLIHANEKGLYEMSSTAVSPLEVTMFVAKAFKNVRTQISRLFTKALSFSFSRGVVYFCWLVKSIECRYFVNVPRSSFTV